MPTGPRLPPRSGAGPGRGPRARATGRKPAPRPQTPPAAGPIDDQPQAQPPAEAPQRRSSLTTRAIALAVVLLILTISYATSLRIYFAQSADIAATRAEIGQRQGRIVELQSDLDRWQDPEYVRTQARLRLGWVIPGEVGYRVVGENGQPLGGGAEINSANPPEAPPTAWWDTLWGSVEAADKPAPARPRPTTEPTITEKTKPGSLATPR